jgi:transitional endoplasmic reticulum ATPase
MSSLRLRVAEAATKDVGRALARLDPDDLRRLGLQTGDVIEIRGKSIAVAKALPSHPAHRGHSRIALDGLTRENAQAAIDDLIEVAPAPAAAADRVEIIPLGVEPSRRDLDYIGRLLDGLVVRDGHHSRRERRLLGQLGERVEDGPHRCRRRERDPLVRADVVR